ncbi:MAG: FAD-dependent oxidoreductase [Pleurocapsa sp. SU_196_0]|nr:FAD-dependent oxidoreductase [Pleurocapsa sp. SU_196_0]
MEGRRQALEYMRFLRDQIPGYEHAELGGFSVGIGVRETRRIRGEYWITKDDVLSARKFADGIAQCGAPIEEHHAGGDTKWEYLPDGETVDIPYRALQPQTSRTCSSQGVASALRTKRTPAFAASGSAWRWGRLPGSRRRWLETVRCATST